jgi:tetratricopeptide (TPR) repeat protein
LRRRGSHIGEARLAEGPGGELLRDVGGRMANLDGQLSMGLEEGIWSVDDLLCAAEEAEEQGSLAQAESLYTTAMRADLTDPVIPFNLGNIYEAQGRSTEAKVAWQIAVARDPAFAEGWYNLALTAEDESQTELAIAAYKRSIEARPDFTDGLYNLAFLLTELERCREALPLWERLLELGLAPEQAKVARNAAALCRMTLQRDRCKSA